MRESEGEAWSEDEGASSTASREDNVCNHALHVVGLHGPVTRSLFPAGLGVGKGGTEPPHGPGPAVPGNAGGLVDVVRSQFGSRALSVQVNIVAVSAHVFHSLLLVSCSLCLHLFAFSHSLSLGLMSHPHAVDAFDRPVPKTPIQFTSSKFGCPNSSVSDIDGMGTRPGVTVDEKLDAHLSQFAQIKEQIPQIPTITGWMSRMEHVTTALGGFAAGLTEMERGFSALTARMCKTETGVTYASHFSSSARSWPSPGLVDGPTAAGSLGPESSDDSRNTRRRLDTF